MKKILLLALLTMLSVSKVHGQAWSGVIAPNRGMDWSNPGASITNRTTQCGSTVAAYSGTSSAIESALSSCAGSNGFVQLGAGTFTLSTSLVSTASNVTLRGMGPNQTFLVFTAVSSNCNGVGGTSICIWNGDSSSFQFSGNGNIANWTAGYGQSNTVLTFSNTTNLSVGKNVILSQNDDTSDTGNILFSQTSGVTGAFSQQGGQGVAKAGASQTQNVVVVAINGNQVTVTPGIYAPNWTSGKSPTAWWSNNASITGFGLENLGVDYSNLGEEENGIEFHLASNCWVKNVRSINNTASGGATHKHVNIYDSNHVTVRDSYFYGASPTSEGYGVDNGPASSNDLTENNIFQHLPTGTINETTCCNVISYNYAVDDYYNNGAPNWQQQNEFHHGAGDYYILWEGNEGIGFDADDIHGTSAFLTHFREYLNGHDPVTVAPSAPNGQKNQATFAYSPFSYNRYDNVIGSVLGTATYHTHYQNTPTSTTDCSGTNGASQLSVFVLGFSDQAGTGFSPACVGAGFTIYNDALVASSLVRWGNYAACTGDSLCNSVHWDTSETASTAPVYPGLASPSETLPASFYYTAKPSFWGTGPWPGVGPDVSSGNISNGGGHANHTPAGNCYLNTMGGKVDGSSGPLAFNATQCYGNGTPQTAAPVCSPSSGPQSNPVSASCTSATSGATICATNDGSPPTGNGSGGCTHGTTLTGSISVSSPGTLKAVATKAGNTDSGVTTNTYTVSGSVSTIDWSTPHQVIDGFGAAIPLSPNPHLTTTQQGFYFGTGTGQLGLSILRVGVSSNGGYGPGDCTTISVSCEGYYLSDMQAAQAQGARIYASAFSPPAAYKTNSSLTCSGGGGSGALATGHYADFATWIATFIQSLSSLGGVNVYALSVQNEPNNCPAYDGAEYSAAQFDTFIKTNLGPTFSSDSINTLIFMPETDNYSGLNGYGGTCMTDSSCYNFVGGNNWHDYDATGNSSGSGVNSTPNPWSSLGKKYWETETSCAGVPPDNYGPLNCETGFTTDMQTDGLMWANIIDDRMVNENANAWLYWALVGTNVDNEGLTSQAGVKAQRAFVLGQYSKFIRPNYVRISATHIPQSGVAVSAYQNTATGNLVIVATNYNSSAVAQSFSITNAPNFSTVTPYVTSVSQSLAVQSTVTISSDSYSYMLAPYSVTTFVGISSALPPTLATPTSSLASGKYTSPQTITLTCPPGAACGFTVDGSNPTTNGAGTIINGTTYTAPFSQSIPVTLKLIATEAGYNDSTINTYVYTLSGTTPLPPGGLTAAPYQ